MSSLLPLKKFEIETNLSWTLKKYIFILILKLLLFNYFYGPDNLYNFIQIYFLKEKLKLIRIQFAFLNTFFSLK